MDGINNIIEAQQKVGLRYFEDGSIESAIPPLKILLHMMAYGHFEGKEMSDPELRGYFEREYIINSNWYMDRLKLKQKKDIYFYTKQINYLESFINKTNNNLLVVEMDLNPRLQNVKESLNEVSSSTYLESLEGTIGADPLFRK